VDMIFVKPKLLRIQTYRMSFNFKNPVQSFLQHPLLQKYLVRLIFPKSLAFWLLLLASILTLSFNFLPDNFINAFGADLPRVAHPVYANKNYKKDLEFNPKLAPRFQSVESIVYYVQKHAHDMQDQKEQLEILTKVLRQRFHHAYAIYGMHDNWMAVFAGKFIWNDLVAKVIPADILQDDVAACSQVSIVTMACCKQLGIDTRKVGLKGHYALEAKANGEWYFVDANLKPDFSAIGGRKSLAKIIEAGELYKLYANTSLDSTNIAIKFSEVNYSKPNIIPAPKAYVFHFVTKILSHWLWLILLVMAAYSYRKEQNLGIYK